MEKGRKEGRKEGRKVFSGERHRCLISLDYDKSLSTPPLLLQGARGYDLPHEIVSP